MTLLRDNHVEMSASCYDRDNKYMIRRKLQPFGCLASALWACVFAVAGLFLSGVSSANADSPTASFSLYPNAVSVETDSFVSIGVFITSTDQSINGASGVLHFPSDLLEAVSVDTSDSIIKLWVTQPKISNEDGTVSFGGVAFNPGFKGSLGRVLTIRFRAKAPGIADLKFSSPQAFINDGLGTQIPATMSGPAHISIGAASSASVINGVSSSQATPSLNANPGSATALPQTLGILLLLFMVIIGAHNGYSIRRLSKRVTTKPLSEQDKQLIKKLKKDIDLVEGDMEKGDK